MKRISRSIGALILTMMTAQLLFCSPCAGDSSGMLFSRQESHALWPEPGFFNDLDAGPVLAAKSRWPSVRESSAAVSSEAPSFSTAQAHKYLGYCTLVLAGLAAATNSSHELHRATSYAATWLAGATCATGFAGYNRLIDFSDGLSANDTHALLGALGTAAFLTTVILAEADNDDGHGGIGAASTAALGISVLAVKIEW